MWYNPRTMERFKGYLLKEWRQPIPESEKGIMPEPLEKINKTTKNKSKDLAVAGTIATFVAPPLAFVTVPVAGFAAAWSLGDHLQDEVSQYAKRELKGNKSSGVIYQKTKTA
jgi:hypothetical protein